MVSSIVFVIAALIIVLVGAILQGVFIAVEHKEKYVPAVILKGLASCCFVIVGFLGYKVAGNASFAKMVFLGLIFGALGDIFLNLRFVFEKYGQKIFLLGIALFLTGHILYLVALIPLSTNLTVCLAIGAVLAAVLLAIIFKKFEVKIAFKIFGIFYLGAICLMTAVAIGNLIAVQDANRILYAIGAVAFLISDVVLIFNTFGSTTKFSMRITNLSFYYLGQILIAFSLFFIQKNKPNLTQPYGYALSGISASFISDLENGKPTIELGKAIYLANLLGIDIELKERGEQK